MANVRGIFRLKQVYEEQLSNNWSVKSDVWLTPSPFFTAHPFGYFASGTKHVLPTYLSSIERIDFDNDTNTTLRSNLTTPALSEPGAVGDASSGYIASGYSPSGATPEKTTVERISYSNDTATASIRGPITQKRYSTGAAGNRDFGYIAGGATLPGPTPISTVDRIDYSNDTAQAPSKGPLGVTTRILAGVGNNSYGYFGGGHPGITAVQRVDYSNDTVQSTQVSSFSPAKGHGLGAAGNANFGWFAGGTSSPSSVVRLDYSNDTDTPTPKGNLNVDRFYIQGTGTQNYGYFGGGYPSTSSIDRIDYANDTATATPKGNFAVVKSSYGAVSPLENAINGLAPASSDLRPNVVPQGTDFGYFVAGYFPKSTVDRVDYSNDTATAVARGPLASATYGQGGTGNGPFGYFGGGGTPGGNISTVQRIEYANDSATASPKGPLSAARRYLTATGNQNFGYFGSGGPSPSSTIDRVDYSNDTATAVEKGPHSVSGRYGYGATGNQNFGYFGGGLGTGAGSLIDRVDYANDTNTASPKGNLFTSRSYLSATGNASFGYFGSGLPFTSVVDRIDYSNDTATASPKGPLTLARDKTAATGNTSFGYFGGGNAPGARSTVDRVDYSNDTATASPRGPLSVARYAPTASSSRANAIPLKGPGILEVAVRLSDGTLETYNTGYFGGGQTPSIVSSVDRIDYSNDTAIASSKGSLSFTSRDLTATGNQNFGYFGGGYTPNPFSTVSRIDYSNDTATASTKGPLSSQKLRTGATGNSSFGYFGGGQNPAASPSNLSTVDRIDYSNDGAAASPKGPLSLARTALTATGNQDFGYFGGGELFTSIVDRIDYSNDTATASPKGPLSVASLRFGATGNSSFGYFAGGFNPTISAVSRIDYSNDTVAASPKGPLSAAKGYAAATGDSSFGYFAGGVTPSLISTVDRIDYSNDTATASPKGPLSSVRGNHGASSARANGFAAVGPAVVANVPTTTVATNFGYFGNGNSYRLDRIDYTNDTATALNRISNFGYGPSGSAHPAAASSNYAGYWAPATYSYLNPQPNIRKVDYSNDTTSTIPGALMGGRYKRGATGNKDFGYFAGGSASGFSGTSTTVSRIDYANDNAAALERGPLVNAMRNLAGVGNQNFGYFQTGAVGPGAANRIDYSNDTTTASPSGSLGIEYDNGIAGNGNFAYIAGGSSPTSRVLRFDYSNDTATASQRTYLSIARYRLGATGNKNFGYFSGGRAAVAYSTVDRIDYSNDTANASPKGPLSGTQYQHGNTATSAAESNNPQ